MFMQSTRRSTKLQQSCLFKWKVPISSNKCCSNMRVYGEIDGMPQNTLNDVISQYIYGCVFCGKLPISVLEKEWLKKKTVDWASNTWLYYLGSICHDILCHVLIAMVLTIVFQCFFYFDLQIVYICF